ncbi:3-dehydroquinate synthase [Rapidithrix thailandica]|uniref:3-dehydroquinate synthase n=1 Tax=Rapidithrix thailandica TaxID=413964 RepID=A0AAW9SC77_9BACT
MFINLSRRYKTKKMKTIQQSFSVAFQYPVLFTQQLFSPENLTLSQMFPTSEQQGKPKIVFVIDEGVAHCHPALSGQIATYFQHHSQHVELYGEPLIIPGGEASKNDSRHLQTLLQLIEKQGVDRHSYLAAIGGGAVLDLAGFAAAIAHRGIRLIRIPTTVLSQNDSGVGVKNSINYFGKKNFLGTFAPPFAVINDSQFLNTLDDRDWRGGIAEAIKVALIKDKAFFEDICENAEALRQRKMPPMESLIHRCAELHVQHISSGDPFEMGSSRPLDFGHWAAHKLEQMTSYQLRHGEAVAIGIALDVTYSYLKQLISEEELQKVMQLMEALQLKIFVPELLQEKEGTLEVLRGLDEFREHLGGELTIMLLQTLGKGKEVHQIDRNLMKEAIKQLKKFQGIKA